MLIAGYASSEVDLAQQTRLVTSKTALLRESNPDGTIQGRVSKWVTNGSKTALTEVTDFLASITVKLHDSLGSRHSCAMFIGWFQ
jgi:hypothetical protein